MLTCTADETVERLAFPGLVAALERALVELQDGSIACPPRLVVALADGASMLSMPAVAADVSIHKLITVVPGNARRGVATIQGHVTVLDTSTGTPLMQLDGPVVTGRRTAALSMLAVRRLAPKAIRDVLLIGTGAQARHHADALACLHPDGRVHVRGTSREAERRFCAQQRHALDIAPAVHGMDIDVAICCTTSRTPVYVDAARADRLLIAVGAFQPEASEIAAATVRGSAVHVDDPDGARHEAGDLIRAGIDWTHVTPLAQTLAAGWVPPARPRLFKSVGCAAWDLAAARVALASA